MGVYQKYEFFSDDVNMPEHLIDAFLEYRDTAEGIDYEEFICHVEPEQLDEFGFCIPLSEDWHVGFQEGSFDGWPCVSFNHSGIEHIYLPEDYTRAGGPKPPAQKSYLKPIFEREKELRP